jgi:hypothetical protein
MSLSIAGKSISRWSDLSGVCQLSLRFIDGASEWFEWAANVAGSNYALNDETELAAAVQNGLHAAPLVMLPTLRIHIGPAKLMTFTTTDLQILAKAEMGDTSPVTSAQLGRVLADHRILSAGEFDAAQSWLAQIGAADWWGFHALGFAERVEICGLMNSPPDGDADHAALIDREAAAFACEQARASAEFCDYVRLYRSLVSRPGFVPLGAADRSARAAQAVGATLPLLFGALDCPLVAPMAAPGAVAAAVKQWLDNGRKLGFSRISEALTQVWANGMPAAAGDRVDQAAVSRYLDAIQTFVTSHPPQRGTMAQDGNSCSFESVNSGMRCRIRLSDGGVVSIAEFCPV